MSANNWRVCPKCKAEMTAKRERTIAKARAMYGKVTSEAYERAIKSAEAFSAEPNVELLREDWELYTDKDGVFHVAYRASCSHCGLNFQFRDTKNVLEAK
jgi:hypothetical protein